MNKNLDIKDDEFRIIGKPIIQENIKKKKKPFKWYYLCIAALVLFSCVIVFINHTKNTVESQENGVFDPILELTTEISNIDLKKGFSKYTDTLKRAFTEKIDTTINDIPLSIYIPQNAYAELVIGRPDINDTSIIFCTQAADIRRDNGKIVGAFVCKGEPLAWGLSKKGYCAILDNEITVGVSDNSPLFEEATNNGGYFFRQYPLVDNGILVENEPKNKAIRKALCTRNGEVSIVASNTKESFHDFAQALVDLGIENAIYLVGSEYANGWYIDDSYSKVIFSLERKLRNGWKYENYIVWKSNEGV